MSITDIMLEAEVSEKQATDSSEGSPPRLQSEDAAQEAHHYCCSYIFDPGVDTRRVSHFDRLHNAD